MLEFLFKDNLLETSSEFLRLLRVRATTGTIKRSLEQHPDFPSLLSISDSLSALNVDNLTLNLTFEQLLTLNDPAIVQIREESSRKTFFAVVKGIVGDKILYLDPRSHKWVRSDLDKFRQEFTGVTLLGEAAGDAGEADFKKRLWFTLRDNILALSAVLAALVIFALRDFHVVAVPSQPFPFSMAFGILSLFGLATSLALTALELDQNNPSLAKLCARTEKVDCNAVLESKYSRILGIPWSTLGTGYFLVVSILSVGIPGFGLEAANVYLALFATIALPYTVYSIVYQWRVIKQWCLLCLLVQGVLFAHALVAWTAGWLQPQVLPGPTTQVVYVALVILISVTVSMFSRKLMAKYFEGSYAAADFRRLKHNPVVFEAFLKYQLPVSVDPENIGLVLGSNTAKYKILKVCNPYCPPCSETHHILMRMLNDEADIQLRIIYSVTDMHELPVRYFLGIAKKEDPALLRRVLADWYGRKSKNFEEFVQDTGTHVDMDGHEAKLSDMSAWCHKMNVFATPTFYVNGYQLPAVYSIDDIKYYFS